MRLQNAITAIKHPHIMKEFAVWKLRKLMSSEEGVVKKVNGVSIGGFSSFSEYLQVDDFWFDGDYNFFHNYSFGPGAIIDIGANMGVLSLGFSTLFPDRTIHAIEANPHTFATLQKNIALNRAGNIRSYGMALSDRSGMITFNADPIHRGTASITASGAAHAIEVPCRSLDDFVSANVIGPIAAVKLDVEGYETLVLRGAQHTLATNPPGVVFFEVCPTNSKGAGFAADEPARLLIDAGYELFRADSSGGLVVVRAEETERTVLENWIALHKRVDAQAS